MWRGCAATVMVFNAGPYLKDVRLHQLAETARLEFRRKKIFATLTQLQEREVQVAVFVHLLAPRGFDIGHRSGGAGPTVTTAAAGVTPAGPNAAAGGR